MFVLSNKWTRHIKSSGGRSRTKSGRRFRLEQLEPRVVLSSLPASMVSASTLYGATATMTLQNFDGTTVPMNKGGDTYPSIYTGEGSAGTVSINTTDAVEGNSLQANVTTKGLYLQFNPYDSSTRGFARDYAADPSAWQFNTYNRMSFWIKRPTTASPLQTGGMQNVQLGTYVKQVTNADPYSDETGGGHYYHMLNLPNDGQWTQVILNMHPDHQRGDSGGVDPGNLPHPTGEPQFNYFDALTRFYIDDTTIPDTGTYQVDDIQFYQEPSAEDDAQVSSLTGTYDPTKNEVIATWNRLKDDNSINDEVRYAFSDIHQIGWNAATPAPNGIITPPGWQGYNGMVYDTTALPLAGHSVVYIAIKPQNSSGLFSEIAVPLNLNGPPSSTTAPAAPTNLTATPGNAQVSLSWSAATGATSYNLYRATTSGGEGSTPYLTGLTGTTFTDTGLTNGTTYYYQVTAVNSGVQSGQSSEASASPKPATTALDIDTGGPAVGAFVSDKDFSGSSTYSNTDPIDTSGVTNPASQAVYDTERYGNFTYRIPNLTAGANYTVRLHFAEIYWNAAGQRVFNVSINGTPVLSNFDIFAAAGGKDKAIVEQFTTTANSSGQIVIRFTTVKDNAKVSGIEIVPA